MMGASYKTKKALKESIGQELRYEETSIWKEMMRIHFTVYKANGSFCVVGPSPRERKWFANVMMIDNKIAKVS